MDPYQVTRDFEKTVADWAGATYGVAVESCTAALFLSLKRRGVGKDDYIRIPKSTYPSVPCSIIHAGAHVSWSDELWEGAYELGETKVIDSALRFKKDMYMPGTFYCLSFHLKKHLPIGRGGMILTDDKEAYEWFRRARFDGRGEMALNDDNFTMLGWNMYMTPEQSSRGLQLFQLVKNKENPDMDRVAQGFPDLSKYPIYTQ